MTYDETLERIHSFNRFGSRLGLERMEVLLGLLGNPQDAMKVIHVAGTNGKGSVCRYLYTMLQEQGFRVGLYTSPFLERFTERIVFDGEEISPEDLVSAAEKVFVQVDRMLELGYDSPTEFELVTAIAFVYFADKPMDYLVLEVGLGGRGDSTNLIKRPLLSIIASISFDHMAVLGDTLEAIAFEKAGILKEGCPVLVNVHDQGARQVILKRAEELGCPVYDAGLWRYDNVEKGREGYGFDLIPPAAAPGRARRVELSMMGMHQVENALCALAAIDILQEEGIIEITETAILTGMKKAVQPGRFEILGREPYVIVDGAHNEDGVASLADTMEALFPGEKILLIAGILADKDGDGLVSGFCRIPGDVAATEPDNPRKLSSQELARLFRRHGRDCQAVGDWQEACRYAKERLSGYDVVLFAGSLYLIGNVRGVWKNDRGKGITGL